MALKDKLRIVLLTHYPVDRASFNTGVETASAALLEGLSAYREEFEFHVIDVSRSLAADVREVHDGVWFHFLCASRQPWLRPRLVFAAARVLRELHSVAPDLVHCHDDMAFAAATMVSGYPAVFTIHGVKKHEARKRTGWEYIGASVEALFEPVVHSRIRAFICISQYASDLIGSGKLKFTIPNAIGSSFMNDVMSPLPIRPRILFVGVLAPLKRPMDLLEAHEDLRREVPGLETLFCGEVEDGKYVHAMEQRIRSRNIQGVRFLGRVGHTRLPELFGRATVLVLPSGQENAPMVIAEAMGAGLPVVASRVGGVPEMICDGETGLIFEAGSVEGLKQCLRRIMNEPGLRATIARRAGTVARARYSPEAVARATVQAYRQILAGTRSN